MTNLGSQANKRALVTGGNRGIGASIARRLAAEGADVAITYRTDPAAAATLVAEIEQEGCYAHAYHSDIGDPAQVRALVEQVAAEFGAIDLLTSNAGVEHYGALTSITPEEFDRVFHVNVAGQLFLTQAAAAVMPPGGRVVLTSSVSARVASYHHALYASSKAAVSALVLSLAPELAELGIGINAIAPGPTNTDMGKQHAHSYTHPALRGVSPDALVASMNAVGRLAEPDEIAAAVAFLLSQDATHLTGTTLDVAGGWN
ncbi:SDR family oxidoreductase [Mycolicibacterium sp. 624]|uniref:SDR family NAD(P)-dependent oxidoreductase n=1 Tax=Mycolicibacterium sp. 624 TaxID=3156314 RepID=UPI003391AC61